MHCWLDGPRMHVNHKLTCKGVLTYNRQFRDNICIVNMKVSVQLPQGAEAAGASKPWRWMQRCQSDLTACVTSQLVHAMIGMQLHQRKCEGPVHARTLQMPSHATSSLVMHGCSMWSTDRQAQHSGLLLTCQHKGR